VYTNPTYRVVGGFVVRHLIIFLGCLSVAFGQGRITAVTTSDGPAVIAQNTWTDIYGSNLVPATTPAGGVTWNNAPEFASGQMPTTLNGVSVTVNGLPAYISFYCSSATTLACGTDQINILTPLDNATGSVPVVVKSGGVSSNSFMVTKQGISPSFFLFSGGIGAPIAALHADYSLLGTGTGFTAAADGETILLFGTGFGLPTTSIIPGASSQSGQLPITPTCYFGHLVAQVNAAYLISPGLYQFNVVVPAQAPATANQVYCTYQNESTNPLNTISVAVPTVQTLSGPLGFTYLGTVSIGGTSNKVAMWELGSNNITICAEQNVGFGALTPVAGAFITSVNSSINIGDNTLSFSGTGTPSSGTYWTSPSMSTNILSTNVTLSVNTLATAFTITANGTITLMTSGGTIQGTLTGTLTPAANFYCE
jgi:uncharacterized protein (TIGR03437 family)